MFNGVRHQKFRNNKEKLNRSFRRKIMSSRGIFILAITWIVMSPFWFWAENIALGIIWLCGGVIELFIALVRRSKRRKTSKFRFKL